METVLKSPLFVALVGLVGAWLVGNALATRWQLILKRKELELQTAQGFYREYGEFFAIWKLWNQWLEDFGSDHAEVLEQRRREVYDRAAAMEGRIEAILLKMASEVVLEPTEQQTLGQLRQAFGVVRYCVKKRKEIPYTSSNNDLYLELKRLSTEFGVLLAKRLAKTRASIFGSVRVPTAKEAEAAWREITANKHEETWKGRLHQIWSDA